MVATAVFAILQSDVPIPKQISRTRESTGWKERLQQELHEIFKGRGENFFDGY